MSDAQKHDNEWVPYASKEEAEEAAASASAYARDVWPTVTEGEPQSLSEALLGRPLARGPIPPIRPRAALLHVVGDSRRRAMIAAQDYTEAIHRAHEALIAFAHYDQATRDGIEVLVALGFASEDEVESPDPVMNYQPPTIPDEQIL